MYKEDLALNNQHRLINHKTLQVNQGSAHFEIKMATTVLVRSRVLF